MPQIRFSKKFNRIENKQLAIFSLILTIVSVLNIIGNILFNLSPELNILLTIGIILHLSIFFLAKKDRLTEKTKYYFFNFATFCLLITWVLNGGLDSSTPIYFFIYFSVGVLSNSEKYLKKYIFIFCLNVLLCIYIELFHKDIIYLYPNETAKFHDLIASFILGIVVFLVMLFSYKKIYILEQKALLKKTLRLERSKKELVETKNIATNAVKVKSNFLSNISHEIRTPLNGIIGSIDLLKTTSLDENQKSLLNNLSVSSTVLIELISDILDLSKLDADKMKLKIQSFDLFETLKTLEILTNSLIKDKDIHLNFNLSANTPKQIISDEGKLKQILINFLSNANKFTLSGYIDVFVDFNKATKELFIRVKDTGIGIKNEDYTKLFQPFSQIENNLNNPLGGVGLGLLISSKFAELLNGKIEFKSEYGKGSVFSIKFPVEIDEGFNESIDVEQNVIKTNKDLESMDILIVEDNQINQIILSKMLQSFDCYYSIANNGSEAVELVKNQSFDVILMDLQMPVKDGVTATKEIVEYFNDMKQPCPKIIGCTANALQEDKIKCLEAGMVDVIVKPVKLELLKETLQNLI